jgi:hypothetical protein
MKTYCNPLDLAYRFQVRGWAERCLREAADPSVVLYRDRYWMFPSKSGGYWHSADLLAWTFVPTRILPTEDYAPDARVIDDAIWFTASRADQPCSIYRSRAPEKDEWELQGAVPAAVAGLRAERRTNDPRTADIAWEAVPGADGYVIHWGIAPDKLYSCWHVLEACRLELNALTAGVPTWVAVEAFNANGRSPLCRPLPMS